MHQIKGRSAGNVVEIVFEGDLTPDDYVRLVREVEALVAEHGATRMLWDLRSLTHSEFDGLWDETTLDVEHAGGLERIALVGDDRWQAWADRVIQPFENAEVRRFGVAHLQDAADWLAERA